MTENTPSDAMVEAMALWERADQAGEDAYVEAVQIGVASADDAHKCGAIAAAAVIADAMAAKDAELAEARAALEWLAPLVNAVCNEGRTITQDDISTGKAFSLNRLYAALGSAKV